MNSFYCGSFFTKNDCFYILLYVLPVCILTSFSYVVCKNVNVILQVPLKRVHLFTIIQFSCLVVLWVIKSFSSTSILFPLMVQLQYIILLVCTIVMSPFPSVVRRYCSHSWFSYSTLYCLCVPL